MPAHIALLLLLGGTIWTLLVERAPHLLALLVISAVLTCWSLNGKQRALTMGGICLGIIGFSLSQGFFYMGSPRTAWIYVWQSDSTALLNIAIYKEGLLHGLLQGMRISALGLFGSAVFVRYPSDAIIAGLRWLKLPPAACFLLTLVFRQTPILMQACQQQWRLRQLRGPVVGKHGWLLSWFGWWRRLLSMVFCYSDALAEGMLSRGITPATFSLGPLSGMQRQHLRLSDVMLLSMMSMGLTALISLKWLGWAI